VSIIPLNSGFFIKISHNFKNNKQFPNNMMLQAARDLDDAKRFIYSGPAYKFIEEQGLEAKLKFVPLSQRFGKTEDACLWELAREAIKKGCYFISGYKSELRYGEFRCTGEGVAPYDAQSILLEEIK